MGIRFACPNGHPLHVKAELAGKRGICPVCQVRFVVPVPQGVGASDANVPVAAAAPNRPAAEPPQSAIALSAEATPQPAEQIMWYVRPATGGQFGPADETVLRAWAAEGRVGGDAYVWRTGWPDWRLAAELPDYFPQLSEPVVAADPSKLPADYNQANGKREATPSPPADVSQATARYQRRKQRSARGQMLAAIVLLVLALVLAGVLFWVIRNTSGEQTPVPIPPATQLGDEANPDESAAPPMAEDESAEAAE